MLQVGLKLVGARSNADGGEMTKREDGFISTYLEAMDLRCCLCIRYCVRCVRDTQSLSGITICLEVSEFPFRLYRTCVIDV